MGVVIRNITLPFSWSKKQEREGEIEKERERERERNTKERVCKIIENMLLVFDKNETRKISLQHFIGKSLCCQGKGNMEGCPDD